MRHVLALTICLAPAIALAQAAPPQQLPQIAISANQTALGPPDAASPAAQTLSAQNALAGSATNVAGQNTTFQASLGTGNVYGGDLILAVGKKGSTGTAQNTALNMVDVTGKGHVGYGGSAPVVSACGTGSPAVDANATDTAGTVTFGAGAGSCTVTFNVAYATYNHCVVTFEASLAAEGYTFTLSALTITATALSGKADYHCEGK